MKYPTYCLFASLTFLLSCKTQPSKSINNFLSNWSDTSINRPWAGGEYWLNPLQAWRQKEGKLYCEVSGGDRNVALLTREINNKKAAFEMSVDIIAIQKEDKKTAIIEKTEQNPTDGFIPDGLHKIGWAGFQVGLRGRFNDYRDDVIKGKGLCAGITTDGRLFIGDYSNTKNIGIKALSNGKIKLSVRPDKKLKRYKATLSFLNESSTVGSK